MCLISVKTLENNADLKKTVEALMMPREEFVQIFIDEEETERMYKSVNPYNVCT